ncbi:MAG: tetratricopeptide repeat protein [Deltaproteobacteria bacterium]|nr:tetratricopeptide repeat protein [Deltaproteobacteria bacterium]
MTKRDPLAETLREALASEAPASDEDAMLARAIDRAMDRAMDATATAPTPIRSSRRSPRSRVVRYAIPIAAAFAASVAMGAVYTIVRSPSRRTAEPVADTRPLGTSPPPSSPPAPSPPRETAPTMSVDDLPNAAPSPAAPSSSAASRRDPAASATSPADLFRDANAARRSGDVDGAIDLYKTLLTHHAGTPEAHAARVTLGRLLLDRRGDASGALAQFDAYLASNSADRALAEEARVGRALVFLRQGRTEEERRAWQELLDKHPDSLHAARARERLRALAPSSDPLP